MREGASGQGRSMPIDLALNTAIFKLQRTILIFKFKGTILMFLNLLLDLIFWRCENVFYVSQVNFGFSSLPLSRF